MTKPVTVRERVRELVQQHGSYRKAAAVVGVGYAHLYRIGHGQSNASDCTLERLGLDPGTAAFIRLKR